MDWPEQGWVLLLCGFVHMFLKLYLIIFPDFVVNWSLNPSLTIEAFRMKLIMVFANHKTPPAADIKTVIHWLHFYHTHTHASHKLVHSLRWLTINTSVPIFSSLWIMFWYGVVKFLSHLYWWQHLWYFQGEPSLPLCIWK